MRAKDENLLIQKGRRYRVTFEATATSNVGINAEPGIMGYRFSLPETARENWTVEDITPEPEVTLLKGLVRARQDSGGEFGNYIFLVTDTQVIKVSGGSRHYPVGYVYQRTRPEHITSNLYEQVEV